MDASAKIKGYIAEKKWAKAAVLCEFVLEQDPSCVEIYPLLGRVLALQGQIKEAIAVYEKSLSLQSRHAVTYADLGRLFRHERQLAKAIAHYQLALTLKPEWPAVRYSLATLLHELRDWDAAIEQYRHVIALDPTHRNAVFNLAVAFDQKGQLEEAAESYRQLVREHPGESSAFSNLGNVLSRQGKVEEAFEVYQQGLVLHPEDAKLLNNVGQALVKQGNLKDAIATYQRAISIEPDLGITHHNLGYLWLQHQDYPRAVACFQTVLALEPNNIEALSDCGHALMLDGQWQTALGYFRQSIALQPAFVDVFCQRANRLLGKDALEKARIACAQFLRALQSPVEQQKIHEFLWQNYWFIGEVLYEYGSVAQAEGYYHKAIALNPRHVDSYWRLGSCLAQQDRQDAAIAAYRTGLALNPIHQQLNIELGFVLEQQGHFRAAVELYEQFLPDLHSQETVDPHDADFPVPQSVYPSTGAWIQACASGLNQPRGLFIAIPQGVQTTVPVPHALVPLKEGPTQPDCGGVTCAGCMNALIQSFSPVPVGRKVFRCQERPEIPPPAAFVATIPKGRAWIAPQKNAWMICKQIAIITPDNYVLGDVSRFYPWYLPGCQKHGLSHHPLLSSGRLPPVKKLEGNVAILSSLSGHVYYHWMVDVLPRWGLLQKSGLDCSQIDWFVVNSLEQPFQRETLETLGIPLEKVIESDREPHLEAQQLVVPSFPGYLDWVPPETIDFLRQTFLPPVLPGASQRIYVSRARANYRQVINETEVIARLKKLGFVSVCLEDLSVAEQVNLFAAAQVVVSPHGSSLTNLVFCQPGTAVLELFAPNYVRTDYWMVSQSLQLQHYYLMGEKFACYPIRQLMHQTSLTEDIWVDLEALDLAIQAMDLEINELVNDFAGELNNDVD